MSDPAGPTALPDSRYDIAIVGAGIVGLATALRLQADGGLRVVVVEAEPGPARHQTGHNSGVIHSGLYYAPGSAKAVGCVEGRRRLLDFCDRNEIRYELCGKLVIATSDDELPRLDELERRGRANGLRGLQRLPGERIAEFEPHAVGLAALHVPETGIVDYTQVAHAYARRFQELGGELRLGTRVVGVRRRSGSAVVETDAGTVEARSLINCAGLQSDRVARLAGARPRLRIVPFRGDYFDLAENRRHLLRGLIYPVPDPRFPFLGVHLTRRIDGSVEAGPNAVLALHRHGYAGELGLRDAASALLYPGTWVLGLKYWRIAASEFLRAGSPERFARALARFVPEITAADLEPGGCGIRAQALSHGGRLLDDFAIERSPGALHVLNAPSPAATASLAIAERIVERAHDELGLLTPGVQPRRAG